MFGQRLTLFRVAGFPLRIDFTWIFIAFLITWSLAVAFFPARLEELTPGMAWFLGLAGMLGLFGSVVLHELGHALVARRFDLEIKGITLFIFGGIAEMTDEPPSAKAEFFVAIGGPLVSLVLALVFWGAASLALPAAFVVLIGYLAAVNSILLLFNLIPAFPLDGGRVLRAALWKRKGSLRKATRISSKIGAGFGFVLMGLGLYQLFMGVIIGAIWWFLIGLFLRHAAHMSYQQVVLRRLLEGESVKRFMTAHELITIPIETDLQTAVEDYFYRYHHKLYPVVEDGRYVGVITPQRIRTVAREEWPSRQVREILVEPGRTNTLEPNADAMEVLSRMHQNNVSRMIVAEGDRALGVLTLKDLLTFLSLKVELEDEDIPMAGVESMAAAHKRAGS